MLPLQTKVLEITAPTMDLFLNINCVKMDSTLAGETENIYANDRANFRSLTILIRDKISE